MASAKTLTPKEIAHEWGVSPKTLRKFLRQDEALGSLAPGKGGRWALPAGKVKSAQKRFIAWKEEEARKRAEALATRNATEPPESDTDADSPETGDELEGDDEVESPDSPETDDDE